MHCPRCGAPLPEDGLFCGSCGFLSSPPPSSLVPPNDANRPPIPTPPQVAANPPRSKRGLALPLICIFLATALVASGVVHVFQWMQTNDLQSSLNSKENAIQTLEDDAKALNATIEEKNNEIDNKTNVINQKDSLLLDRETVISELENLLHFYETYVVVVPDDSSELYHTYGCAYFDDSYFWAFNTSAAEQKGYNPCPYCQ